MHLPGRPSYHLEALESVACRGWRQGVPVGRLRGAGGQRSHLQQRSYRGWRPGHSCGASGRGGEHHKVDFCLMQLTPKPLFAIRMVGLALPPPPPRGTHTPHPSTDPLFQQLYGLDWLACPARITSNDRHEGKHPLESKEALPCRTWEFMPIKHRCTLGNSHRCCIPKWYLRNCLVEHFFHHFLYLISCTWLWSTRVGR